MMKKFAVKWFSLALAFCMILPLMMAGTALAEPPEKLQVVNIVPTKITDTEIFIEVWFNTSYSGKDESRMIECYDGSGDSGGFRGGAWYTHNNGSDKATAEFKALIPNTSYTIAVSGFSALDPSISPMDPYQTIITTLPGSRDNAKPAVKEIILNRGYDYDFSRAGAIGSLLPPYKTSQLTMSVGFDMGMSSYGGTVTLDNGATGVCIGGSGYNVEFEIKNWKPLTTYQVTISGFRNTQGVEMLPVTKQINVPFKTIEPPKPKLVNVTPSKIDAKTRELTLEFDMDVSETNGTGMTLNGNRVNFQTQGKRVKVELPATLKPGTEYALYASLCYVEDIAHSQDLVDIINYFGIDYKFTTSGTSTAAAPQIVDISASVANGAPQLNFTFNETMASIGRVRLNDTALTGAKWSDSTKKVLTAPLPNLKPNTSYVIVLDGDFVSAAGGKMEPAGFAFATGNSTNAAINPTPTPPAGTSKPGSTTQNPPPPSPGASVGKGKVNGKQAAVYPNPSTKGKKVGLVSSSDTLTVLELKGSYAKVQAGSVVGYVPLSKLAMTYSAPAAGTVVAQRAVAYSQPKANKKLKAADLPKGSSVAITGRSGSWYLIDVNGKAAYVQVKNIKEALIK